MAGVPGVVDDAYWGRRIFEPFVLRLHQKLEPLQLPDGLEQRKIGPYGAVLENWDSPGGLSEAICGIADYHCRKMEGGGMGPGVHILAVRPSSVRDSGHRHDLAQAGTCDARDRGVLFLQPRWRRWAVIPQEAWTRCSGWSRMYTRVFSVRPEVPGVEWRLGGPMGQTHGHHEANRNGG